MENRTLWLLAGLVGAVALFVYSRTKQGASAVESIANTIGELVSNRGLRDNNPGNVRRSQITWQGELTREQVEAAGMKWDADFEQLDTIPHGVRMVGRVLTSYANLHGLRTVRGIISRYAPASENDTEDYIQEVCAALGVAEYQTLDVHAYLPELATAIMNRETGFSADPADIRAWVYS